MEEGKAWRIRSVLAVGNFEPGELFVLIGLKTF
jgi:hypothetical protein